MNGGFFHIFSTPLRACINQLEDIENTLKRSSFHISHRCLGSSLDRWDAGQCGHVPTLSSWISCPDVLLHRGLCQVLCTSLFRLHPSPIHSCIAWSPSGCICLKIWWDVQRIGLPALLATCFIRFICLALKFSKLSAPHFANFAHGQNNIIARNSNGVYEGVAIGGDRRSGSFQV